MPRSRILLAARSVEPKKEGYGAEGKPEQTFKPSNLTKETYRVRPATPYDLVLPYRTDEIEWYVDREMVRRIKSGDRGLLEQNMFSEDSMRGLVTVRALDNDPTKESKIVVARWEFNIDPCAAIRGSGVDVRTPWVLSPSTPGASGWASRVETRARSRPAAA